VEAIAEPSSAGPGSVLLGNPKAFARVTDRAGAGSVGTIGGPSGWVLKVAGWLGIGGMDMVADLPRWKRSRWLPVVLLTERNADGSGVGVALTARTGRLLGDYEGPRAFMARPLHWGGPARGPLRLVHSYPQVPGAVPLGDTGLYAGGSLDDAQAWVTEGQGSSLRFRFFLNNIRWAKDELRAEVTRSEDRPWIPVRCSADLVLAEVDSIDDKPLWVRVAELAGGEAEAAGRRHNLI